MTKYALQQSLSVELLKGEEDGEKREGRDTGRGGGGPLEDGGGGRGGWSLSLKGTFASAFVRELLALSSGYQVPKRPKECLVTHSECPTFSCFLSF